MKGMTDMSKIWFVTGSSRGFGRKIVEAALKRGDQVVATARKPDQLDDLARAYGDRVLRSALDVTDSAAAKRAIHQTVGAFGSKKLSAARLQGPGVGYPVIATRRHVYLKAHSGSRRSRYASGSADCKASRKLNGFIIVNS
jgi:NAD(P)-dependent dehydrogenase (short-subunit alcohol dehydrogenase family)